MEKSTLTVQNHERFHNRMAYILMVDLNEELQNNCMAHTIEHIRPEHSVRNIVEI